MLETTGLVESVALDCHIGKLISSMNTRPSVFRSVMPVRSLPAMWEQATVIMLGKLKQGEIWIEESGGVPCPEVRHKDDAPKLKMVS